jgi:hypothetical protein
MEDTKKTAPHFSCPDLEKIVEDLRAQICELKLNIEDQTVTIKDQNTTIAIQGIIVLKHNNAIHSALTLYYQFL